MNKCKKNILLIFGYLLMIALLIVPYIDTVWRLRPNEPKDMMRGWIFWPVALISGKYFSINMNVLTTEIAVILLAAGFAYILFCIVLKKGNK